MRGCGDIGGSFGMKSPVYNEVGMVLLAVVLLLNALVAGLRRWGESRHARPAAADGPVGVQP